MYNIGKHTNKIKSYIHANTNQMFLKVKLLCDNNYRSNCLPLEDNG